MPALRLPDLPALWTEHIVGREICRGGRVQFRSALHVEGGVADRGVFEDTDGKVTVRAAASWKGGVFEGEADLSKLLDM